LLSLARRGEPVELTDAPAVTLRHRDVRHPVRRWWKMASFTTLASSRAPFTIASDEAHDRDEQAAPLHVAAAPVGVSRSIRLLDFPRGPRAGVFFHALLEELDFAEVHTAPDATRERVDAKLRAYGYDPALAQSVMDALGDIVDTPLASVRRERLRLRDVARDRRRDELEFYLPVANRAREPVVPRGTQMSLTLGPTKSATSGRLTARRLADVFVAHPSPQVPARYASELETLGFPALEGFLKGYIDLVFEHQGCWYVVDYKTNHLGEEIAAYAADRLPAAMAHGHYYLQYHLYSLALHRLLASRLAGYDYDTHFGGVLYLFVKGMTPETGARSGVFFEKPPRRRIEALSELLQRPLEGNP
jgi:exodeoxyribonuclease V beta subunit